MGVVTGVVLSYEIGANWSGFSRSVSNVLGPMLMYEVLTAFFLEAGFIGIVLFGEGRVGRGVHAFACCMVAAGTLFSATWVLAANSWMQTPAGAAWIARGFPCNVLARRDPQPVLPVPVHAHGLRELSSAAPSSWPGCLPSTVSGAAIGTARKAFSMAMWTVLILAPLQIVLGDMQGLNTRRYQPTKLAAMEGLWESGNGVPPRCSRGRTWRRSATVRVEIPHVGACT